MIQVRRSSGVGLLCWKSCILPIRKSATGKPQLEHPGEAVVPVNEPLKVKLPFSSKPEIVLFCTRIKLNPKAISCFPRMISTSSAAWKLFTLKCPGAQVPQNVLNALLTVSNRKFGTALYILTPSSVGLIGVAVGPRLSRIRLKAKWNEFSVPAPNLSASPTVAHRPHPP